MSNNLSLDECDIKTNGDQIRNKNRLFWVAICVLGMANVLQFCYIQQKHVVEVQVTDSLVQVQQNRRLQTDDITSLSMIKQNTIPGWNPVYVYTGESNKLNDNGSQFHGQLLQDEMVIKLLNFKRNGYFIDLAANEAVGLSNTYVLERDYDWTGLCIEPNPEYWYSLAFRKCQTVGAMVGKNQDEEVAVVFGKKHLAGIEFRGTKRKDQTTRRTANLERVFNLFKVPKKIDYLSLDVEGAELFIMEAFPFDKYQFSVLSIEWVPDKLKGLLLRNGYKLVHHFRDWETLWVHKSMDPLDLINKHKLKRTWDGETTEHKFRVSMPDP